MLMIAVKKVEEGVAPPTHNGFPIQANGMDTVHPSGLWCVDTGLEFALPDRATLRLEPAEGVMVLSWTLAGYGKHPPGRLVVIAMGALRYQQKFATVCVVKEEAVPVRFVEHGPEGGRLIRGDAKVACSVKNRGSKP